MGISLFAEGRKLGSEGKRGGKRGAGQVYPRLSRVGNVGGVCGRDTRFGISEVGFNGVKDWMMEKPSGRVNV